MLVLVVGDWDRRRLQGFLGSECEVVCVCVFVCAYMCMCMYMCYVGMGRCMLVEWRSRYQSWDGVGVGVGV